MSEFKVIKDKDPIYEVGDYDVVLVGTSVYCTLTGGFQSKMRFRYPILMERNDRMPYGDMRRLGTRLTIECDDVTASLLYVCTCPSNKKMYLDYDALERCLRTANAEFKGKRVLTTVIGASRFDGNGDKERCLSMMREYLCDVDLTVYDYNQLSRKEEKKRQTKFINSFKHTDPEKYHKYISNKEQIFKKLYLD